MDERHRCEPPMCGRTECFVYGCRECHNSDGSPALPDSAPNGFCRSCGANVYEQLKAFTLEAKPKCSEENRCGLRSCGFCSTFLASFNEPFPPEAEPTCPHCGGKPWKDGKCGQLPPSEPEAGGES